MNSTDPPATPLSRTNPERRNDRVASTSKRLTLSFPVLSPPSQRELNRSLSPGRVVSSATSVRSCPLLPATPGSPTGSSNFLTSLAAQERRVLELREELQKAEADLLRLKKQWARHEAGRKKAAMRQLEPLQPITPPPSARFEDAPAWRAAIEAGRNRPIVRKSTQRVFSGSRHTRTLSLLSPDATNSRTAQSRGLDGALSPTVTTADVHSEQSPFLKTTFRRNSREAGFGRTYKQLAERNSAHSPTKDAFVTSGKKVAADLREGLWTFFEDIRQATVGEEGINGTETRVMGTRRLDRQAPRRLNLQGIVRPTNVGDEDSQNTASLKEWQDTRYPYEDSPVSLDDQAVASPHM